MIGVYEQINNNCTFCQTIMNMQNIYRCVCEIEPYSLEEGADLQMGVKGHVEG